MTCIDTGTTTLALGCGHRYLQQQHAHGGRILNFPSDRAHSEAAAAGYALLRGEAPPTKKLRKFSEGHVAANNHRVHAQPSAHAKPGVV